MYIGIDLGTSGVKLALVKKDGEVIKTVSKSYEVLIPRASWTEQDPYTWFDQTFSGLKNIILGYEDQIEGIGFSGQMHGLVILDDQDRVLRNALLWNDQRTIKEVDYLNEEIGIERLLEYTGNIALTGLTAPKILWVKNNEPEIFEKISKIMLPKDYIAYRLSGVFASDVSDLSGTLFFDCKNKQYSKEMLEILSIKEEMLPQIFESYEKIGYLTKDLSELLHIHHKVPIIIGGGDQAVGAVGMGIVNDGEASISLGTSGVVFVASDTYNVDYKNHFQSYAHANDKYHTMAVMLNAAGTIKWWLEQILQKNDFVSFYQEISKSPIDDSIFFLPYLTGERAPVNDPYAKGVFFGLGAHHTQTEIGRAVVEGVTFGLKDSFEQISNLGIDIKKARITGGGAKSHVWVQMIADMLNIDIIKIHTEEGPALGAAILAMVGAGAYDSVSQACETIIREVEIFHPISNNHEEYQKKYQTFQKLYPNMKPLFPLLSEK